MASWKNCAFSLLLALANSACAQQPEHPPAQAYYAYPRPKPKPPVPPPPPQRQLDKEINQSIDRIQEEIRDIRNRAAPSG